MFWRKQPQPDQNLTQIVELLKQQQLTPQHSSLLSAKNINALVIAGVIGAFAFLWTNVASAPEQFSAIASQTAEIRTTVVSMKNDFADFRQTLGLVKSQTDTIRAEIEALKKDVKSVSDRLTQLERDTR